MTPRRWMLALGIFVAATIFAVFVYALTARDAEAGCASPYPCHENEQPCRLASCLGECRCDLDSGECVPLYEWRTR